MDQLIWSCLLLRWIRVLLRRVFKRKIWSILVQISFCHYHDLQAEEEAEVVVVEEEEVVEVVEEVVVVQEVEAVAEVAEEVLVDEALEEEVLEEEEADVEEVASKSITRIVSCKRDTACLFISKLFYIEIRLMTLHHFIPFSRVDTSLWTKAHQVSMGSTLYDLTI